jgi:hypothetical protein
MTSKAVDPNIEKKARDFARSELSELKGYFDRRKEMRVAAANMPFIVWRAFRNGPHRNFADGLVAEVVAKAEAGDPISFDVCAQADAVFYSDQIETPPSLRPFVLRRKIEVAEKKIKQRPRGGDAFQNERRNWALVLTRDLLRANFPEIPLMPNPASPSRASVCSLLSEVLSEMGLLQISPDGIRKIFERASPPTDAIR